MTPLPSLGPHVYRSPVAHKGMAMVPKRAVDVMAGQVVRLLQLTQNAIVPIGYHVQRKVSNSIIFFQMEYMCKFNHEYCWAEGHVLADSVTLIIMLEAYNRMFILF